MFYIYTQSCLGASRHNNTCRQGYPTRRSSAILAGVCTLDRMSFIRRSVHTFTFVSQFFLYLSRRCPSTTPEGPSRVKSVMSSNMTEPLQFSTVASNCLQQGGDCAAYEILCFLFAVNRFGAVALTIIFECLDPSLRLGVQRPCFTARQLWWFEWDLRWWIRAITYHISPSSLSPHARLCQKPFWSRWRSVPCFRCLPQLMKIYLTVLLPVLLLAVWDEVILAHLWPCLSFPFHGTVMVKGCIHSLSNCFLLYIFWHCVVTAFTISSPQHLSNSDGTLSTSEDFSLFGVRSHFDYFQ